jgi:predicted TIM-barrel fold metal-dependent hydrolase
MSKTGTLADKFDLHALREYVEAAGLDRTIVGSDLGPPINPLPVEGFRAAIQLCLGLGSSAAETRALTSQNACRLIGTDPPAYQSA